VDVGCHLEPNLLSYNPILHEKKATKLFLENGVNPSYIIYIRSARNDTIIKDLEIDGNKNNNTSGTGIFIYGYPGSYRNHVYNCYIHDCAGNGIIGNNRVHGAEICFNRIANNNVYGVSFSTYSSSLKLIGNYIADNGSDGIRVSARNRNGYVIDSRRNRSLYPEGGMVSAHDQGFRISKDVFIFVCGYLHPLFEFLLAYVLSFF